MSANEDIMSANSKKIEDICDKNRGHNVRQNINKYNNTSSGNNKNKKDVEVTRACAHETAASSVDELTNDQILEIIDSWNRQKLTKQIFNIHRLSARENNTRLCIGRVGFDEFLLTISKIDQQAFFQKSADNGNPVRFDWFVRPDNFQKVLEGNYTQEWKHKSDGKKLSVMEEMESWI